MNKNIDSKFLNEWKHIFVDIFNANESYKYVTYIFIKKVIFFILPKIYLLQLLIK